MRSRIHRFISFIAFSCLLFCCLTGCGKSDSPTATTEESIPAETVDYASELQLNMDSPTRKQEVTVHNFVDGDTVHFNVPEAVMPGGILKARFLAINTPESTGKIEEYGKAASNFTREKLSNAVSIIIESDTAQWDADSTGDRYLVWVWYKTADMSDYRNLNIEILQNGLAIASSSANNIYGDTAMAAIAQAKALKLNVHSGEPDPDFFYGDAVELDLKELRLNVEDYNGMKVAFNGIVTINSNNGVYVESFDSESDMFYGISVYYGFGLSGHGLRILEAGNEVRIVGTVQYYETGGTWQISGLSYRAMDPDDPSNIQMISQGHTPSYRLTDPEVFANGSVDVSVGEDIRTVPYAQLALGTTVEMKGLLVTDVYTTDDPESSSNGAMTLTCQAGDVSVSVRTIVLRDAAGNMITSEVYLGKTIDVKGVVDSFDGTCQIKVFSEKDIIVQ